MPKSTRFFGPMVELSRLQSEINRLFAVFVETNHRAAASSPSWDPNVDVLDDGEKIRLLVELPGVETDDIRVTIRGRVVTIRGSKRGRIRLRERMKFYCMERYFGSFAKSVPTPRAVNCRQARTVLKNGLLEVILPGVPDMREKEFDIPVRSEEEE